MNTIHWFFQCWQAWISVFAKCTRIQIQYFAYNLLTIYGCDALWPYMGGVTLVWHDLWCSSLLGPKHDPLLKFDKYSPGSRHTNRKTEKPVKAFWPFCQGQGHICRLPPKTIPSCITARQCRCICHSLQYLAL